MFGKWTEGSVFTGLPHLLARSDHPGPGDARGNHRGRGHWETRKPVDHPCTGSSPMPISEGFDGARDYFTSMRSPVTM